MSNQEELATMKNLASMPTIANTEFVGSLNTVRLKEEEVVEAIRAA
jgi:hypothetical protein